MVSSLFGMLLYGYTVVTVPTCISTVKGPFTHRVSVDQQFKLIVIEQYGSCQTA